MADPINEIREAVAVAIQAQTGALRPLEGFRIEPVYDRNKAYTPPLILLLVTEPGVAMYTIGDDVRIDTVTVEVNLLFKETLRKTVEGTLLSGIPLSDWYMAQLLETLKSVTLPADATADDPVGETNEPTPDQPYLFGCTVRLRVEYRVQIADVAF